ncbi:glycosyltransferase [uncultured Muribaculum sp.]|uniref:glycosyltransferase n=1 Tax=uncultured Muribaculum sp. TaxID=1918613 RepID=UPI002598D696|nr:glycosyltransferase [uncultured Muribaculum sp.]
MINKILFCDNSLRELLNFRGDVIDDYSAKGNEIVLLAPKNRDYPPDNDRIKYIPIEVGRSSMNPFSDFKYFFELIRIYRKEKPDYIFHYTIKPNIYGSFAAKLLGIPSTAMIAGLGYVFTNKGLGCWIARMLYRISMLCPEKVLVLNEYNQELLIKKKIVKREKIILLKGGEGVNLSKFS